MKLKYSENGWVEANPFSDIEAFLRAYYADGNIARTNDSNTGEIIWRTMGNT